jgi:hypothetical protein
MYSSKLDLSAPVCFFCVRLGEDFFFLSFVCHAGVSKSSLETSSTMCLSFLCCFADDDLRERFASFTFSIARCLFVFCVGEVLVLRVVSA